MTLSSRLQGMQECAYSDFRSSDETFCAFHRIWQFKRNGEVVWDREKRIDLLTNPPKEEEEDSPSSSDSDEEEVDSRAAKKLAAAALAAKPWKKAGAQKKSKQKGAKTTRRPSM